MYFVEAVGTGTIKIGQTDDIRKRLWSMQVGCPNDLKVLGFVPETVVKEHVIHAAFKRFHIRGEWFKYSEVVRRVTSMLVDGDKLKSAAALRWIGVVSSRTLKKRKQRRNRPPLGEKRMGRPKLPDEIARQKPLRIRLNEEERRLVDEAAEASGYRNTSAWVRGELLRLARRAKSRTAS